jgi:predicted TIM-barrel fold metal-dependent hydrolase
MIVDTDTHVMLPDAFEYMEPGLRALAPRLAFREQDGSYDVVEFAGRPGRVPGSFPQPRTGNKLCGAAFMEDRLEDLMRLRVDKQLLMSNFTGWWSYLIEPELGAAMAQSHNVSMLKVVQRYPDAFLGIALVALQNVEASIEELQWAKDNGFSAAVVDRAYPIREHPFGTSLGEHLELWPFFEQAEQLGLPLFIHNVLHGHSVQNCPRTRCRWGSARSAGATVRSISSLSSIADC